MPLVPVPPMIPPVVGTHCWLRAVTLAWDLGANTFDQVPWLISAVPDSVTSAAKVGVMLIDPPSVERMLPASSHVRSARPEVVGMNVDVTVRVLLLATSSEADSVTAARVPCIMSESH